MEEKIIEEFKNLAPEYGHWRIDRNLAGAWLKQKLSEYRQSLIASIEGEIAKTKRCECSKCNEIEGNYNMGNNQCLEEVKEILNKYK
jgi:hypothetical protein